MYIAYYDESGDDGYPDYSSPLFCLSALYIHYSKWQDNYEKVYRFRCDIKKQFGLPVKWEVHAKHFLLNKKPYKILKFSEEIRVEIIDLFCELIGELDIRVVNVVINKTKITGGKYDVLDKALTYSIQRIENDLVKINQDEKFMIITDEGRSGKMRKTSRKIRKFNYIPSRYTDTRYRQEIRSLIEDPLPKDSKESYFIQLSDLIAYIIYLYSAVVKCKIGKVHNRLPKKIDEVKIFDWMSHIKNSLNIEASREDKYGVVCYPI